MGAPVAVLVGARRGRTLRGRHARASAWQAPSAWPRWHALPGRRHTPAPSAHPTTFPPARHGRVVAVARGPRGPAHHAGAAGGRPDTGARARDTVRRPDRRSSPIRRAVTVPGVGADPAPRTARRPSNEARRGRRERQTPCKVPHREHLRTRLRALLCRKGACSRRSLPSRAPRSIRAGPHCHNRSSRAKRSAALYDLWVSFLRACLYHGCHRGDSTCAAANGSSSRPSWERLS